MKKKFTILLALLLALLLAACTNGGDTETPPPDISDTDSVDAETITVRISEAQPTLDPANVTARGGEAILFHLFENLMRWEDDGHGWAVIGYGQAENYTVDTDYAGNSTYTFTLREDIRWSDGTAVTANDFVTAWQRLAGPNNNLPHQVLLEAVSGYAEVQETGDASLLGVSAPDEKTFVVSLNGSPSYFLEEVCASAYTMPICPGAGSNTQGTLTNGPYIAESVSADEVVLRRSETYYKSDAEGPACIRFQTITDSQTDYEALQTGDAALVIDLPSDVLQPLAESGLWTPEPVTQLYGVLLNTQRAPFDDVNVRMAFRLAVDLDAVVDALGNFTLRPAPGVVPYGVADYSERPVVEEEEEPEPVLPDPNAAPKPEKPAVTFWDFRSHGMNVVTLEYTHDYETDSGYAQALMVQAGYPGGKGFPAVEYLYVEHSDADRTLAETLQDIWKECLGVSVTVRGVSEEEYLAAIIPAQPEGIEGEEDGAENEDSTEDENSPGDGNGTENEYAEIEEASIPVFTMAAQDFTVPYSDAGALLDFWHSRNPGNVTGYASPAFDILLNSAHAVVSPDARDAYLHDAEAILLNDAPVIPILCQGGSYQLREGLKGLYRGPNGVYFLQDIVPGD